MAIEGKLTAVPIWQESWSCCMTRTWWLYVGAFLAGIAITVMGFRQGNAVFVAVGLVIGVALYFQRGRIQ